MTTSFPSPFGNEHRQNLQAWLDPSQRAVLEQFAQCRIDLIRSTQWQCDPPWFVPRRVINNEFFLFVLDGALQVESPQGKRVLRRGECFYTAPGEFQSFGFTGSLHRVEHILIHCRVALPGFPFQRRLFRTSFLRLPHPDAFLDQLRPLPYLWETWSPSAQGCAEGLLRTLFMDLGRDKEVAEAAPHAIDPRIASAILYLREHLHEDLPMERIAEVAGLSPVHFRRTFRKETGRAPLAFLTETRLEAAGVLLQNSRKKLKEIARSCGFNDVDYFCRLFREKQGCTPSTYRHRTSRM